MTQRAERVARRVERVCLAPLLDLLDLELRRLELFQRAFGIGAGGDRVRRGGGERGHDIVEPADLAAIARDILVDLAFDSRIAGEVQRDIGRPPAGQDFLPVAAGAGKHIEWKCRHDGFSLPAIGQVYQGTVPGGRLAACAAIAPEVVNQTFSSALRTMWLSARARCLKRCGWPTM